MSAGLSLRNWYRDVGQVNARALERLNPLHVFLQPREVTQTIACQHKYRTK